MRNTEIVLPYAYLLTLDIRITLQENDETFSIIREQLHHNHTKLQFYRKLHTITVAIFHTITITVAVLHTITDRHNAAI